MSKQRRKHHGMAMGVNKFVRMVFGQKRHFVQRSMWEQIRVMIQDYPDLLFPSRFEKILPFHGLCNDFLMEDGRQTDRLRLIKTLMGISSSCLLVQDSDGVPVTYLLRIVQHNDNIDPRFFKLVINMIQAEPTSVMMHKVQGKLPLTTALHEACGNHQLLPIVDMILSLDCKSAYELDSAGDLPLHRACICQQLEIAKRLILFMGADKVRACRGLYGDTPLHSALYYPGEVDRELIQLLVDGYPSFLTAKNQYNEIPLHLACLSRAPYDVMEIVVRADRQLLGEQDLWGNLPLHRIFPDYPLSDLVPFMRLHMPFLPKLIQIRNIHGELPGQEKGLLKRFEDITSLLEKEHKLIEIIDSIKAILDAICVFQGNETVPIIMDWLLVQKDNWVKELSTVVSELDKLVATDSTL
jgi:ankyrin repeat protein